MLRPYPRRDIAVQVIAPQQGRVAVDVAALERFKLGHAAGVFEQNAGVVHEFGQTNHARMIHQRHQIGGLQPRAGGFHMGRGHAGRQVDANIHQGAG